jgi:hypothetical protein
MSIVHYVVLRERERERDIQTVRERKRREEDLPPRFPSTKLFSYFYTFLWLFLTQFILFIFLFYFVFVSSFIIFALFTLFCRGDGDGYKHTPN